MQMDILDNIGNTPLYKINDKINDIYLKFEGANSFGSAKDRSAKYVLNKLYLIIYKNLHKQRAILVRSMSGYITCMNQINPLLITRFEILVIV